MTLLVTGSSLSDAKLVLPHFPRCQGSWDLAAGVWVCLIQRLRPLPIFSALICDPTQHLVPQVLPPRLGQRFSPVDLAALLSVEN